MNAVKVILLSAGICLAFGATATGNTYKWTDDNGQVQYTQLPPNDRPYTVIRNTAPKSLDSTSDGEGATRPAATVAGKGDGKSTPAGYNDAEKQKLAQNCKIAKENHEMLRTAAKIRVTDEKGEPRHLTDEERKTRMADTQKQMEFYCKD